MEEIKERLQCKDIDWFLKNVDPTHELQKLDGALAGLGEVRNKWKTNICLDSMGETDVGQEVGLFQCHGQLGNQGFLMSKCVFLMTEGQ